METYYDRFSPAEVARRRAIRNPAPGTQDYYDWNIQKIADDWTAGEPERAKRYAEAEASRKEAEAGKIAEPLKVVKERDIMDLLTGGCDFPDGEKNTERIRNWFKPVNPDLLDHLNRTGGVDLRFSYPDKFEERVKKVWNYFGRRLDIRPIANPNTNRFGPSASIQFPRPAKADILKDYPRAYQQALKMEKDDLALLGTIIFYDVRLALQLYFQYGFDLSGSPYNIEQESENT